MLFVYHYKLLCWWNTWFCLSNLHSLWAICGAWHDIFRRLHADCLSESETEWQFGFAFAFAATALSLKASVTLIQRLCLFRICDNIVDATNLNDYVRELSLHFVVKLFVTTAWNAVNSAHSSVAERWRRPTAKRELAWNCVFGVFCNDNRRTKVPKPYNM